MYRFKVVVSKKHSHGSRLLQVSGKKLFEWKYASLMEYEEKECYLSVSNMAILT